VVRVHSVFSVSITCSIGEIYGQYYYADYCDVILSSIYWCVDNDVSHTITVTIKRIIL